MGSWITTKTTTLIERTCWCGMLYAIPAELSRSADRNKNTSVYCPLGHAWVSTTHERDEKERLRQRVASLEDDLRVEGLSHRATKGALTKAKKRVEAGLCLHCNRSFQNLARHMATKHKAAK